MTSRTQAWQCLGCGRLESSETCIGVCQDRKVEVVSAADYDAVVAELDALRLFVRQLALVSPRAGQWERTYKALTSSLLTRIKMPSAAASSMEAPKP